MADEVESSNIDEKSIEVLMAEDNEVDVKIALRAFSRVRIKSNIYVVRDGQEALDYIYHKGEYQDSAKYPRPDLILLDINMPRLNGMDVLNKLKSDSEFELIPVIMLTSSKEDEDVLKSYDFGASSFISKPIDYESFTRVVESLSSYWHVVSERPDEPKQKRT